jgi:hypothetical protein
MVNFKMLHFKSSRYERIADQEEGQPSDIKVPVPDQTCSRSNRNPPLIWIITTFVLAGLAGFFFTRNVQINWHGSFDTGYSSELGKKIPSAISPRAND